jgi:hypothetical protein
VTALKKRVEFLHNFFHGEIALEVCQRGDCVNAKALLDKAEQP